MTTTLSDAVAEYVGRCIEYVQDLPEPSRSDMVDDVRQIVHEVSAEFEGRPEDLLGPPDRFVGELRGAAGLFVAVPAPAPSRASMLAPWVAGVRRLSDRIDVGASAAWIWELFADLRPAGWVLRGYVLGVWLCFSFLGFDHFGWILGVVPVPSLNGSMIAGATVTTAMIVASVQAGRRRPPGWKRVAVIAASILSVMALWSTVDNLRGGESAGEVIAYADVPATTMALTELVSGTVPEAPVNFTDEGSEMAVLTSTSGRVVYVASLGAAGAAWYDLTNGSLLDPVVVQHQGFSASVSSPDALVGALSSWGFDDS